MRPRATATSAATATCAALVLALVAVAPASGVGGAPARPAEPAPPAAELAPEPRTAGDPAAAAEPTGRLLVRHTASLDGTLRRTGLRAASTPSGVERLGWSVVDAGEVPVERAERSLEASSAVLEVVPELVRTADSAWGTRPAGVLPYLDEVRLGDARALPTGTGVVVAVLDSGVNAHPDLAGRLRPGHDLVGGGTTAADDNGHGTAVAGVAAGAVRSATGPQGVAPTASVLPVKVLDGQGRGSDAIIAQGIVAAADAGADVVNLSLGGPGASPVLEDAVRYAVAHGSLVVASSGNDSTSEPMYPAAYAASVPGVLSVSATDDWGQLTDFSSWGDPVSIAAPGWELVAPARTGSGYVLASGTSFSAPMVSGAAARVLAQRPGWTPQQVAQRLRDTARDSGPRGVDPWYGAGVLDVAAALGRGPAVPHDLRPVDAGAPDDLVGQAAVRAAVGGVSSAAGTISPEGDADWSRHPASTPGRYRVEVRSTASSTPSPELDVVLEVRDGEGRLLTRVDAYGPGGEDATVQVDAPGSLLVGVSGWSGAASADRYAVAVRLATGTDPVDACGPCPPAFVTASSVAPRAAGRPLDGAVELQIGTDLDEASAAAVADAVRLRDRLGSPVPVTTTLAGRTLRVAAAQPLSRGHHYQLHVTGLVAADGSVMTEPFRLPFTVAAGGDRFTPVPPVRLLDTRSSGRLLAPGSYVNVPLAAVPAGATAVVLNVTAVQPDAAGFLKVYPGPGSAPAAATLHVVPGRSQPNLVTVPLGTARDLRVATGGTSAHVVADLSGYYSPGAAAAYVPLPPARLFDTRSAGGPTAGARLGAGAVVDVPVRGRAGVPADAVAVVVNLTGIAPTAITSVTAFPAPVGAGPVPRVANLNLYPGRDQPNLVTVALGPTGAVRLSNSSGTVHLVGDVQGYYSATGDHGFVPLAPNRLVDSRRALGLPGPLQPGAAQTLQVTGRAGVPADAGAALVNVTTLAPTTGTLVQAYPSPGGSPTPQTSTNAVAGRNESNPAVLTLGPGGAVSVVSRSSTIHLVVDVNGYFRR